MRDMRLTLGGLAGETIGREEKRTDVTNEQFMGASRLLITENERLRQENGDLMDNLMMSTLRENDIEERHTKLIEGYEKTIESLKQQLELKNKEIEELKSARLTVGESDKTYSHVKAIREGRVRFKGNIDTLKIIELYIEGLSAGRISDIINEGIEDIKKNGVTRQTIINRLKGVGLWGNRETWRDTERTEEEKDYMNRHGIIINEGE